MSTPNQLIQTEEGYAIPQSPYRCFGFVSLTRANRNTQFPQNLDLSVFEGLEVQSLPGILEGQLITILGA